MTMGESSTTSAPAGWYDDPADGGRLRKWDGRAWTDSVMTKAHGSVALGGSAGPPGWHPDPLSAGRLRWWDGTRWSTRVLDGPVFRGRTALGTGFFVLSWCVVGLLVLDALAAAAAVPISFWASAVIGRWVAAPGAIEPAEVSGYENVYLLLGLVTGGAYVVSGVCFVVWLRLAYGSDRVDPGRLRFGAGWTIGAWFVPFLNLVRPFGLVRDLWRGLGDRVPERPGRWLVAAWWGAFATMWVSTVVGRAVNAELETKEGLEALRDIRGWLWLDVLDGVVSLVCAVLAAVIVVRVTQALRAGESDQPLPPAPSASA